MRSCGQPIAPILLGVIYSNFSEAIQLQFMTSFTSCDLVLFYHKMHNIVCFGQHRSRIHLSFDRNHLCSKFQSSCTLYPRFAPVRLGADRLNLLHGFVVVIVVVSIIHPSAQNHPKSSRTWADTIAHHSPYYT